MRAQLAAVSAELAKYKSMAFVNVNVPALQKPVDILTEASPKEHQGTTTANVANTSTPAQGTQRVKLGATRATNSPSTPSSPTTPAVHGARETGTAGARTTGTVPDAVELTMTLAMSFNEAGEEGSAEREGFKRAVAADLALASGLASSSSNSLRNYHK